MKAYSGSRGIAVLLLHLGTRWSTSRPGCFIPGKETRYQLNGRLGGPQSLSGHFWQEKSHFTLPWFELRTIQPVNPRYPLKYMHFELPVWMSLILQVLWPFEAASHHLRGWNGGTHDKDYPSPYLNRVLTTLRWPVTLIGPFRLSSEPG
jgi:hypothetical protein